MSNKLQAKDLINLGLFTVLYFMIGCCVAIPIGFVPIFLPILGALWSLITGIPFMLFLTRVKKFGMVTRHGHDYGDFKRFTDGPDRHGFLGCANGRDLWLAGRFDFEIRRL